LFDLTLFDISTLCWSRACCLKEIAWEVAVVAGMGEHRRNRDCSTLKGGVAKIIPHSIACGVRFVHAREMVDIDFLINKVQKIQVDFYGISQVWANEMQHSIACERDVTLPQW